MSSRSYRKCELSHKNGGILECLGALRVHLQVLLHFLQCGRLDEALQEGAVRLHLLRAVARVEVIGVILVLLLLVVGVVAVQILHGEADRLESECSGAVSVRPGGDKHAATTRMFITHNTTGMR